MNLSGFNILVLAPSSRSNSLGRAIAMASVASEVGDAWLLAENDGPVWAPASQFDVEVSLTSGHNVLTNVAVRDWIAADGIPVLWVCKGLLPLPTLVEAIRAEVPSVMVILDLDDDDSGLAELHRARSIRNRVTLNRLRRMHPANIKRSQSSISREANGFTFSTEALRSERYAGLLPYARVPHARAQAFRTPRRWGGPKLRVGVFGTMRAHKGGQVIQRLLDSDKNVYVHCFGNSGLTISGESSERVREEPPTVPLREAYDRVDVALIPLALEGRGSRLQLPAKLIDAMSFDVPVVASRSPAIEEVLGPGGFYIDSFHDVLALGQQLRAAANSDTREMRSRFLGSSSTRAVADQLALLLSSIARDQSR